MQEKTGVRTRLRALRCQQDRCAAAFCAFPPCSGARGQPRAAEVLSSLLATFAHKHPVYPEQARAQLVALLSGTERPAWSARI